MVGKTQQEAQKAGWSHGVGSQGSGDEHQCPAHSLLCSIQDSPRGRVLPITEVSFLTSISPIQCVCKLTSSGILEPVKLVLDPQKAEASRILAQDGGHPKHRMEAKA